MATALVLVAAAVDKDGRRRGLDDAGLKGKAVRIRCRRLTADRSRMQDQPRGNRMQLNWTADARRAEHTLALRRKGLAGWRRPPQSRTHGSLPHQNHQRTAGRRTAASPALLRPLLSVLNWMRPAVPSFRPVLPLIADAFPPVTFSSPFFVHLDVAGRQSPPQLQ